MRTLAALCCMGIVASCPAQTKWLHQLLWQSPLGEDVNYPDSAVGPSGIPIYGVAMEGGIEHVIRGKVDLNALYFHEPSHGLPEKINSKGEAEYYALTATSYHEMVDGHDYFTERYGQTFDYMPVGYGLDSQGRPLWVANGMKTGTTPYRVYHGQDEISQGMQLDNVRARKITPGGDVLWEGHQVTDPSTVNRYLYLDTTNLSGALLGDYGLIAGADVNNKGEVLWSGLGTNTAYKVRMYLGQQDITPAGLNYTGLKSWLRSDSGHNLWAYTADGQQRLMRDGDDLSTGLFDGRYQITAGEGPAGIYMVDNGDVAWMGSGYEDGGATYRQIVFRNREDISDPALGVFDSAVDSVDLRGMDDAGNVLWDGSGSNTGHMKHTFVNGFDLTQDAWPNGGYGGSIALASGANGSVLWVVGTKQGGSYMDYIYLSTPVPEPSVLLLGLPLVVALRRRR